ncbi:AtMMH-1 [Lentinula lateritia]|uniref:AtMMH-1 n=1 Tax=Lentinula lateritia TaxID=40482 RepID=A0ABQ8VSE6_9AGAR|nr:AtMMH-1 [Lentinula lateritia]
MPELPEVERAVKQIKRLALNKTIQKVETTEDNIVFSGITHEEFANEITGRKITGVKRYGKSFYLELDGQGKLPVLHFGMTGMLQVKGEKPMYYKENPKSASTDWPSRFMKFILHMRDECTQATAEIAFMDARRLGKIRLRATPDKEAPISELGFDPILCMPSLEVFEPLVMKRSCPIKALLLDQSFSAGVGNWVADEILYHSRIHPEQRCNTLTTTQIGNLHQFTKFVCETAVSVDADATKFPEDWLFKHRWGKGKKTKADPLKLVSGDFATIKWVTVGGRTSAYVAELQQLTSHEAPGGSESDLSVLTDSDPEVSQPSSKKRVRKT